MQNKGDEIGISIYKTLICDSNIKNSRHRILFKAKNTANEIHAKL